MIKIVDSISKLESMAEEFENKAKVEIQKKNYANALLNYEEAIDVYIQLNWNGKVKMLDQTIKRLQNAINFENSIKLQSNFKGDNQDLKEITDELLKNVDKLTPKKEISEEVKNKLAKIEMLEKKAISDALKGNFKRSLDRYQLLLEIANELDHIEQIDIEKKISETKSKISELTEKLKSNL